MEDFGYFGDEALYGDVLDCGDPYVEWEEANDYVDDYDGMEDDWLDDAYAAQWDDDPNPYHGDYSE